MGVPFFFFCLFSLKFFFFLNNNYFFIRKKALYFKYIFRFNCKKFSHSFNSFVFDGSVVENLPAMQETTHKAENADLIPGSGRSHEERNGNPLQYSCLRNPKDRGDWQVTVYWVTRIRHNLATKPPLPHNSFFTFP